MKQLLLMLITISVLSGCTRTYVTGVKEKGGLNKIFNQAILTNNNSPWSIANLYNPKDDGMFIPYQLWTGMNWDGDKDAPCMHKASSYFNVNGSSRTRISCPKDYKGQKVWHRDKTNGSKQQYFSCNKMGIGRVYDSRVPHRNYLDGRCKFPAGYGWRAGVERQCTNTSIKITKIEFDASKDLSAIEFEWRTKGYHDHTYRYEVGYGMRNAWKQ